MQDTGWMIPSSLLIKKLIELRESQVRKVTVNFVI